MEKRGSVTYSTDHEIEVCGVFIYLWVQTEVENFNLKELLNLAGRAEKYSSWVDQS